MDAPCPFNSTAISPCTVPWSARFQRSLASYAPESPSSFRFTFKIPFSFPVLKKASRHGTVGQLLHPHLEIPLVPRFAGGTGSRILIHRYHLVIGKQPHRERINMLQITGNNERSGQQAPQGHMGVLFIRSQSRLDKCGVRLVGLSQLPDLENVRVIPMSRRICFCQRSWEKPMPLTLPQ